MRSQSASGFERQGAEQRSQRQNRSIAATVIGNVLEWYDFVVYSFLATIIAKNFFPAGNETAALLATFAVFGVGFVARPLGAIVIGWIGDRRGRKTALVLTILLMAASTVLIGLAPTFQWRFTPMTPEHDDAGSSAHCAKCSREVVCSLG
ncbi:MAG: MHS family MFS transporter [Gammaproteobacteria bacterium]|nr:MHS family MFS transporter [Gammaproteobacteria bacterium]